jgi:hypothetical protein
LKKKGLSICSNLQINKFTPQILSNYVKIPINFSPPFFIIYAVLYYICNFRVSNYVTEIISPNPQFQYIISHTEYKLKSADCPRMHRCILTLLFITMTLITATLNLCHQYIESLREEVYFTALHCIRNLFMHEM